jgi:hypothetical protein
LVQLLGELKHVLNLSKPRAVFCSPITVNKMTKVQRDHPFLKYIVLFGKDKPKNNRVMSFEDIIAGKSLLREVKSEDKTC